MAHPHRMKLHTKIILGALTTAAVVGGGVAFVAIIFGTVKSMVKSSNRERTRREVAAYVAEGSITPEDAERILTAGREHDKFD